MSQLKFIVYILTLLFLTSCSHHSKVSNQHTHKGNRCSKSITHEHPFHSFHNNNHDHRYAPPPKHCTAGLTSNPLEHSHMINNQIIDALVYSHVGLPIHTHRISTGGDTSQTIPVVTGFNE